MEPPKVEILALCGPSRDRDPVGEDRRRLSPALERMERDTKSESEVKPRKEKEGVIQYVLGRYSFGI